MTLALLTLLASRDYPAMRTYVGRIEIGEFCLASVPDVGALFDAVENEVAEQGDTLLKQELWGNGDTDCPYQLKIYVAGSPFPFILIPIAIAAVGSAVTAWQVKEATQTVAEASPFALNWLPILGLGALGLGAIYLLKS